jgi:hypothetical protein
MRRPAAFFPIALALGAISLAHRDGAQAQNAREEGPIEIEKCRTIDKPGSYKLVNNLVAGTGDCLVITADLVTVDLAGFSISGTATGQNVGIGTSANLLGLAVRNGSISGFGVGVDLASAEGSIVEGLRVVGGSAANIDGIIANGIVKGNTVIRLGGSPFSRTGITATGTVTGNFVMGARRSAIQIGEGSTVIGNTATGALTGISVDCPSNLTDNTAVNNATNLVLNGEGCHNEDNVAP